MDNYRNTSPENPASSFATGQPPPALTENKENIMPLEAKLNQASPITPEKPIGHGPKHKMIILLVAFLITLTLGGGSFLIYKKVIKKNIPDSPSTSTQTNLPSRDVSIKDLASAHNSFGLDLLKNLSSEKEANVVISSPSIVIDFSMVLNGAAGNTLSEMTKTLRLENITQKSINEESSQMMRDFKTLDPEVEIDIANSIWIRRGLEVKQEFLDTNRFYFQAEISNLNFSDSQSVTTINNWVKENTKNKIDSIVDSIPPDTLMCLINAVYFKGTWTQEFDKKLTYPDDFNLANGSKVQMDFMKQYRDDFLYFENSSFQAIKLPYGKNKKVSMYIFLPKDNLAKFSDDLNMENWDKWTSLFEKKEGTLLMPKYKLEYDVSLTGVLKGMGMTSAFLSSADFSNIANGLFISEVKHKTFIEVNEEGTEAAAVTGIITLGAAPGVENKTFYMNVNKPFFFAIAEEESKEILFSGLVYNPSQ